MKPEQARRSRKSACRILGCTGARAQKSTDAEGCDGRVVTRDHQLRIGASCGARGGPSGEEHEARAERQPRVRASLVDALTVVAIADTTERCHG